MNSLLDKLCSATDKEHALFLIWHNNKQEDKKFKDLELPLSKDIYEEWLATVYKGNIIKNLIMDCQSYTKYRPNETTGGIFVSWRRKEELPTGA